MASYHVEVVVKATGRRVRMTRFPCTRREAETIASKITEYEWRRIDVVST